MAAPLAAVAMNPETLKFALQGAKLLSQLEGKHSPIAGMKMGQSAGNNQSRKPSPGLAL